MNGTHYKLTNRKTGKVLDVSENPSDEGVTIIQCDDKSEDNDNQCWSWVGDRINRRLQRKLSGLVMDVDGNGKVIQKRTDDKDNSGSWLKSSNSSVSLGTRSAGIFLHSEICAEVGVTWNHPN